MYKRSGTRACGCWKSTSRRWASPIAQSSYRARRWRGAPENYIHTGLQYGPGFRLCKKAYRTDTDAVGVVGPLPGEAVGWLVHPALADSMLHLTAVAPKPPEGGWPWMSDDEKNGVVPGVTD